MAREKTAFRPAWVRSVDVMIENGLRVQGYCTGCAAFYPVDLGRVRREHPDGGCLDLFNKRAPCKNAKCPGYVFFLFSPADGTPFRPLRDYFEGLIN